MVVIVEGQWAFTAALMGSHAITHMTSHLFCEPPSPLTSAASSPWPSPCRKRTVWRSSAIRTTQMVKGSLRYIQCPHWHLSKARRQSTDYRGTGELDGNCVVFNSKTTSAERLDTLERAGYCLVQYNPCVNRIPCFPSKAITTFQ